jgi:uncharacterized protein HemX
VNIEPIWWMALALLIAVVALAVGLVFAFRALQRKTLTNALLEQRLVALQEQTQRELLAMGQHVLAADRLLNRFDERLGRLENTRPGETQYGQLEAILTKVSSTENRDEVSVAEAELRSLLQQRSK